MSAFETTRLNTGFSLLNLVSNLVASIASWNDARVTRSALSKLSDRELGRYRPLPWRHRIHCGTRLNLRPAQAT